MIRSAALGAWMGGLLLAGLLTPTTAVAQASDAFSAAPVYQTPRGSLLIVAPPATVTSEPGEPDHAGRPARRSLWWSLRLGRDAFVEIALRSLAGYRLATYTGSSLDTLTPVAAADIGANEQGFTWEARAGVLYHVAVELPEDGVIPSVHSIEYRTSSLGVRPVTSPIPESAPAVVEVELVELGTPRAHAEAGLYVNSRSQPSQVLTHAPWRFRLTNEFGGSAYALIGVPTNRPGVREFSVGYQFRFRPPNDAFAAAATLPASLSRWSIPFTTEAAGVEPGEPTGVWPEIRSRSVWWQWTPAYTALTLFSGQNLTVYRGGSLTDLTPLGSGSSFLLNLEAGVPLHLQSISPPQEAGYRGTLSIGRSILSLAPPPGVSFQVVESIPTLYQPAGTSVPLRALEANPAESFPVLTLERQTSEGYVAVATASAQPRIFDWVVAPGEVVVLRVTGVNAAGDSFSSDPISIVDPPANDQFANAQILPPGGISGFRPEGFARASTEPGEPLHREAGVFGSVWYRWTPNSAGMGRLTWPEAPVGLTVAIYAGDQVGALTRVARFEPLNAGEPAEVVFPVQPGTSYHLAFVGTESALDATLELYPVEFLPIAAEQRVGQPVLIRATDPAPSSPPRALIIEINGNSLIQLDLSPSAEWNWIPETPGPFQLVVREIRDGVWVRGLDVRGVVRPVNDSVAQAEPAATWTEIPGIAALRGNLTSATREPGEESSFGDAAGTVWFDWTAPEGSPVRALQTEGDAPVRLDLFRIAEGGALVPVLATNNLREPVSLPVSGGTRYRAAISSPVPEASGFAVHLGIAAPNDPWAGALSLLSTEGTTLLPANTTFATTEPDETAHPTLKAFVTHGDLWWTWVAPDYGWAYVDFSTSSFPVQVRVLTGPALASLEEEPNVQDWLPDRVPGRVRFRTRPGVTYRLAVGGWPEIPVGRGVALGTFRFQAAPQLVNDDFADRLPLTGTAVVVRSDSREATTEPGELERFVLASSLWWEYTAPGDGAVRFAVWPIPAEGQQPHLVVASGDTLETLQKATDTDEVYVTAGQRLQIGVGTTGWPGTEGPFELRADWRQVLPPSPNDGFVDRVTIPDSAYGVDATLHGATLEPGEIDRWSSGAGSLWWSFAAPTDGIFELTRLSSDSFTPSAELFTDAGPGSLWVRWPALYGDGAPFAWKVTAGQVLALRIGSKGGTPGEFRMESQFWPHPAHDAFSSALRIQGTPPVLSGWIVDATVEPSEPLTDPVLNQSLWWSWTAPQDGRLDQSYNNAPVWIYRGISLSTLERLPFHLSVGNGSVAVPVQAGETYYFQAAAPAGETRPIGVNFGFAPDRPAANDDFAEATYFEGRTFAVTASPTGASVEPGEPAHGGAGPFRSLWWRWKVSSDGIAVVTNRYGTMDAVLLGVYQGEVVDSLRSVAHGTNGVRFAAERGETYWIAADASPESPGDIGLDFALPRGGNESRNIPGNLVQNFSFEEGDYLNHWESNGNVGAEIGVSPNSPMADGRNYVYLSGSTLRQSIPTQPGATYRLRLAMGTGVTPGDVRIRLRFGDQSLGEVVFPDAGFGFGWHWQDFIGTANGSSTRLEIESAGALAAIDAVSVISLQDPPQWVTPPQSLLAPAGGVAVLRAGVRGTEPLSFQWYFGEQPLPQGTGRQLTFNPLTLADAGFYHLVVTNRWGSITSTPVTLTIDSSSSPRIVRQPEGDAVVTGQFYALQVVAVGVGDPGYQWYRNEELLPGATQRVLTLPSVSAGDLGQYHVVVRFGAETVASLPTFLTAAPDDSPGGGVVDFAARKGGVSEPYLVQVTDVDGLTLLAGEAFAAQLYAGPALESLRPLGEPRPFLTGIRAGEWASALITLPRTAPGDSFLAQVRVWDHQVGSTYEESRALGGRFGRSTVIHATAGDPLVPPRGLPGWASFSLQAGLPQFSVGRIEVVRVLPDGGVEWRLSGAAGFRYLLEERFSGGHWRPRQLLSDFTGEATFTTPPPTNDTTLFRARLLD